jgi:PKD repeat protein
MKGFYIFIALLCGFTYQISGQALCGNSSESVSEPLTPQKIREYQVLDSINTVRSAYRAANNVTKIIPVVVHVLHQNGVENIPESQVRNAIDYLNDAYSASGQYQGGVNTNISFCLSFIDWINTPYTIFNKATDDLSSVKAGNQNIGWDSENFMNIYIVKDYLGAAVGVATIPGISNNLLFDGVVIEYEWFGLMLGSACKSPKPNPIPMHEVGHYLGLYHTFQGACADFSSPACTMNGDKVCDTPPSNPTSNFVACNGDINTCMGSGVDLQDNFMCYNDDYPEVIKFTQGQIDRMHQIVEDYRPDLSLNQSCQEIEDAYFEPNNVNPTLLFPKLDTNPYKGIVSARLSAQTDGDIYKITANVGGRLMVKLNNLTFNCNITLADDNGVIVSSQNTGTTAELIDYSVNSFSGLPKVLYLKVTSPNGWTANSNKYNLEVSWDLCADLKEPNNSKATALPFITQALGASSYDLTIGSRIFKSTDVDWWSIPIENNGQLKLSLTDLPYNYELQLIDNQGTVLGQSYNTLLSSESIIYQYNNPQTTTLYAVVFSSGGAYSECTNYKLKLEWQPNAPCQAIVIASNITLATSNIAANGAIAVVASVGVSPYTYVWSNGSTTATINGLDPDTYTVTVTGSDGCKKIGVYVVGVQGQTQTPFCSGTTTLTAPNGTFEDGSGSGNYSANSNCRWKITIPNAAGINLSFSFFDLDAGDIIKVFDGATTASPLLATFDIGSDLNLVTASGGTMLVQFISDGANQAGGFTLTYNGIFNSNDGSIKINAYEFWFDKDFENRETVFVVPMVGGTLNTSISTDALEEGLHSVNFRFLDNIGQYSVTTTDLFLKTLSGEPAVRYITEIEYWFNEDFSGRTRKNIASTGSLNLQELLDVSAMQDGLHSIHYRFSDDIGQWSVATSDLFYKTLSGEPALRYITEIEYWFNEDFSGRTRKNIASTGSLNLQELLDVSAMQDGLHSIHYRFGDDIGQWSVATSDLFYKTISVGAQLITGYEYWFDNNFANRIMQSVTPTAMNYHHLAALNTQLSNGLHTFHARYQDDAGQWSVVTNDTFSNTFTTVFAQFTPSVGVLCNSGSITFTNNSVGATTYLWTFGDGGTSTLANPTHLYAQSGTYTVTLKATTTSGTSQTYTLPTPIYVDAINLIVSAGGNVCAGSSLQLSATGAQTYVWSPALGLNTTTGSNVTAAPTITTTYVVTGTSLHGCQSNKTVNVNVLSLPTVTIAATNNSICAGQETIIDLSGATTYTISPMTGVTQLDVKKFKLKPSISTVYTIVGQNQCGTDTETFTLNILPSSSSVFNAQFCQGSSYIYANQTFTNAGAYQILLQNALGCDSIVTLNLSYSQIIAVTKSIQICQGEFVTIGGQAFTTTGTFIVNVDAPVGCDSVITLQLSVLPNSQSSQTKQICEGETVTIGTQIFTTTGVYMATLPAKNGCDSMVTLNLTVLPTGGIPMLTLLSNNQLGCSVTGVLYSWYFNGNNFLNTTSPTVSFSQNGNYSVQVTSANGCKTFSPTIMVMLIDTDTPIESEEIQIYPNPTDGFVFISFKAPTDANISIYSLDGKSLITQSISHENLFQVDLSTFPPAIYLLKIETTTSVHIEKIILSRP